MFTLRCTLKLCNHLGVVPLEEPDPPTATLGNWYANLIPTVAGELVVFVNEPSLLTVALHVWESDQLIEQFRIRVANHLAMIKIPLHLIDQELSHLNQVQFGKTASRHMLGSLNDFAWHYQILAEEAPSEADWNLSKAELKLSWRPCRLLDYQIPADVARELLQNKGAS